MLTNSDILRSTFFLENPKYFVETSVSKLEYRYTGYPGNWKILKVLEYPDFKLKPICLPVFLAKGWDVRQCFVRQLFGFSSTIQE